MRIGVVLAVHNRLKHTLAALEAVLALRRPDDAGIEVFLLDDASPDGTADAVEARFPDVNVIRGTGNLYWNGGMRRAFAEALASHLDYYLWLNDDTILKKDALLVLLRASEEIGASAIVVGSTCGPDGASITYGGLVRTGKLHPFRFRLVEPADRPLQVDTMNGNCVLIPALVAQSVGNLDPAFHHGIGDFDYGLRAQRCGFEIWLAPGMVGICERGESHGTWQDADLPLSVRVHKYLEVKGLPPADWATYAKRYGGPAWPIFWAAPYCKLVIQHMLRRSFRWFRGARV